MREPESEALWRTLSSAARRRLRRASAPDAVEPMRPTPAERRPGPRLGERDDASAGREEADWIYEPYYEGRRCIAIREGDTLRFLEDGQRAMAGPDLVAAMLRNSPSRRFVVDGTLVRLAATAEGDAPRPRRERAEKGRDHEPHFYVFDLLQLEGRDTTSLSLVERKTLLRAALRFEPPVHYVAHRTAVGEFVREAASREGWSGVVAKRADSAYVGGASRDWRLWRPPQRGTFAVAGYLDEERVRLVLATRATAGLAFAGFVELPESEYDALAEFVPLSRSSSPLVGSPLPDVAAARWLEPERLCAVEFADWPEGGTLVSSRFVCWQRQPGAEAELTRARST